MIVESLKNGPEKVRISHKSSEFCHYSSPGPMVRNLKFSFGHTAYFTVSEVNCVSMRMSNILHPHDNTQRECQSFHLCQLLMPIVLGLKFISMLASG